MKLIKCLFFLCMSFLPLSLCADDGKVCPVEGGSVQAELTSTPVPKATNVGNTFEYDVSFVLMNSSDHFVNATYVVRDTAGNTYTKSRVLVEPQKKSEPIVVKPKIRNYHPIHD